MFEKPYKLGKTSRAKDCISSEDFIRYLVKYLNFMFSRNLSSDTVLVQIENYHIININRMHPVFTALLVLRRQGKVPNSTLIDKTKHPSWSLLSW